MRVLYPCHCGSKDFHTATPDPDGLIAAALADCLNEAQKLRSGDNQFLRIHIEDYSRALLTGHVDISLPPKVPEAPLYNRAVETADKKSAVTI